MFMFVIPCFFLLQLYFEIKTAALRLNVWRPLMQTHIKPFLIQTDLNLASTWKWKHEGSFFFPKLEIKTGVKKWRFCKGDCGPDAVQTRPSIQTPEKHFQNLFFQLYKQKKIILESRSVLRVSGKGQIFQLSIIKTFSILKKTRMKMFLYFSNRSSDPVCQML